MELNEFEISIEKLPSSTSHNCKKPKKELTRKQIRKDTGKGRGTLVGLR